MTRGDICELVLPDTSGHEQRGRRYGVVVQADELLELSTVIVAPTSTRAHAASFRPKIDIGGTPTRVMVEQLRVVDVRRVGDVVGHVTLAEQLDIDDALMLALGL